MLPSKVTQADNMLVSPADDAHDEVPRARIDKIDKTEVTLNGNISATGVASPPTTLPNCRLKHAQTEAHFEGSLLTEDGLLVKKTTQEDLERGQRFDSHNMLRSDEAADLVHLPGEQQIWLKRGDQSHKQTASAVTVASDHHPTLDAIDSSIPDLPTHITDAEMLLPLVEHPPVHTHTYAKPVISASKSEHRDILHSTGRNRENNNAVLATPVEEYDAYSIRSSVKSRSTAKKSHKSLTRRLSSFLTRSFRRKRHSPSVAGERNEKRISFVSATTSERPESSATRCSSEDPDDFAVLRSQQLLRLGFFLNIDEALRNEPDSFLFVPLTDSGYFSSNFDDIEKFPQLSSQEETFHTGDDLPSPTSTFNTII